MRTVICDYCGQPARLVNSSMVYSGQDHGMIWLCHPCYAWVGVHKGTDEPLGRLADAELRYWKRRAHTAFDPLWLGKEKRTRRAAYEWLAEEIGLPLEQTHIGMMDVDQCKQVIKICKEAKRHEQLQKVQQPQEPAEPQPPSAEARGPSDPEGCKDGDSRAGAAGRE